MYYKRAIFSFVAALLWLSTIVSQQVPYGIKYQAVARNSYGEELVSEQIDVRFSIRSGSSEGNLEYQEVHSNVVTSQFGVFDAVIGDGTPFAGDKERFQDITWETDNYFLGIEIKFDNDFLYMGSMQFLSVPYALYAGRSLEPGPEGPPGPPGDPASDDQTLSFNGVNLAISGGNEVNLAAFLAVNDADPDPENEIQSLSFNSVNSELEIIGANKVDLSPLVNSDNQELSYNPLTHILTISNGTIPVDLDELKDDADASVTNELISNIQIVGSSLVIDEGSTQHSVDLSSNMVAFRVRKTISTDAPMPLSNVDFLPDDEDYNDGLTFNMGTGEFTAPMNGIYAFDINYTAASSAVELSIFKNGNLFEKIGSNLTTSQQIFRHKTIKLNSGDRIKLVVYTGTGLAIGTGIFSGFRVY